MMKLKQVIFQDMFAQPQQFKIFLLFYKNRLLLLSLFQLNMWSVIIIYYITISSERMSVYVL